MKDVKENRVHIKFYGFGSEWNNLMGEGLLKLAGKQSSHENKEW